MKISRHALAALPTALVVAAFIAPAAVATPATGGIQATPSQAAPAPATQGIIMRDGGICDPIRHIGC